MKPASSAMISLLESGVYVYADCYTITPVGGSPLRYTTADIDIAWGGDSNYPAAHFTHGTVTIDSPGKKAQAHWKRGLDVDTWQVTAIPRPVDPVTGTPYPDQIGSLPWLTAARAGILRLAGFIVDRAYLPAWPGYPAAGNAAVPTGLVRLFSGAIGELQIGRGQCEITANDYRQLMTTLMPQNLWQAGCRHTLFGTGCGLSASSYVQTGSAQSGSSSTQVATTLTSPVNPPSPFTYVTFSTSGYNFDVPVFSFVPASGGGGTIFLASTPTYPDGMGGETNALAPGLSFNVFAANGTYQSSTMSAGTTESQIVTSLSEPAQSAGFTLGRILMTSGKNAGLSRTIRLHTPGSPSILTLMSPMPSPVLTGDTFQIWPGCDRSAANCVAFGNYANHGGCPFIPAPETAL